ncbi:MAG: hypothetical protein AAGB31_07630, partial [Bdellovibrio sp.]
MQFDNSENQHFLSLGSKLGLCIKSQDKSVLYQNETSIKTCGRMTGQVCTKACMQLYHQVEECAANSPSNLARSVTPSQPAT